MSSQPEYLNCSQITLLVNSTWYIVYFTFPSLTHITAAAYLAPEALHSLGHFQADRPRADDAHPRRQLFEVPEVGVGKVWDVFQTGDGRYGCGRSRGYHSLCIVSEGGIKQVGIRWK